MIILKGSLLFLHLVNVGSQQWVKDPQAFRFALCTNESQERWDGVSQAVDQIDLIASIWLFKAGNSGKPLEISPWGISSSYLETQAEFYEQKICWEACLPHLV